MIFTKDLSFLGREERVGGATVKKLTSVDINKDTSMIRGKGAGVEGQKSCLGDAIDNARGTCNEVYLFGSIDVGRRRCFGVEYGVCIEQVVL